MSIDKKLLLYKRFLGRLQGDAKLAEDLLKIVLDTCKYCWDDKAEDCHCAPHFDE